MPKRLLADGDWKMLLLRLLSVVVKRPFADGASDVVLLEEPNPEKPVNVTLGASAAPNEESVELAFEV